MSFDLLTTIEYGGCSAKLSPDDLSSILDKLPKVSHERLLVSIDTHDDAGVYKLNDETALIFTTDFFPPVCSNGYEFGSIAATNALSDVYAMGGKPLMALNIMGFSVDKIPLETYSDILKGGFDKVSEAGALLVGGHTIDDHPPKFGLAVIGTVHPDKLVTNAGAKPGDLLILTKPLGTGALIAGHKEKIAREVDYLEALNQMKLLNTLGAEILNKYELICATDVTGFGLLGHAQKMASASKVSIRIDSTKLPLLSGATDIFASGCIPGAAFRNLKHVSPDLSVSRMTDYGLKMLTCDAQTSGGLLMSVPQSKKKQVLEALKSTGIHPQACIIGEVLPLSKKYIYLD